MCVIPLYQFLPHGRPATSSAGVHFQKLTWISEQFTWMFGKLYIPTANYTYKSSPQENQLLVDLDMAAFTFALIHYITTLVSRAETISSSRRPCNPACNQHLTAIDLTQWSSVWYYSDRHIPALIIHTDLARCTLWIETPRRLPAIDHTSKCCKCLLSRNDGAAAA